MALTKKTLYLKTNLELYETSKRTNIYRIQFLPKNPSHYSQMFPITHLTLIQPFKRQNSRQLEMEAAKLRCIAEE